jgi:hypothetical protein
MAYVLSRLHDPRLGPADSVNADGVAFAPVQSAPGFQEKKVLSGQSPRQAEMVRVEKLPGAYVESSGLTHIFLTDMTIERTSINTQSGPQEVLKQERLWQRWETEA